ncbi:hypothetical protein [Frankia gtarii]|uniref:hypothetical protein n=1 Tax=Frankia gtarii TaxID=2950102 RepID=UPI0021C161E0|nr:hypothetical protein [Frankia gtarii]
MPDKKPVAAALQAARRLLDGSFVRDLRVVDLTDLIRRYSLIDFDVPDSPDADGYLFQYGKAGWFSEPTFVLSMVRQLEVVDPLGRHESYIQIQFELRYRLDDGLAALGSYSEWWFPVDGKRFEAWLETVERLSELYS